MKTADLERSKRLKSAGWRQDSHYSWGLSNKKEGTFILAEEENWKMVCDPFRCSAPTAGEMIEWLLGDGCALAIKSRVSVYKKLESAHFDIDDNLCNALADACAWVLERKK